jgi:hypothetical protein
LTRPERSRLIEAARTGSAGPHVGRRRLRHGSVPNAACRAAAGVFLATVNGASAARRSFADRRSPAHWRRHRCAASQAPFASTSQQVIVWLADTPDRDRQPDQGQPEAANATGQFHESPTVRGSGSRSESVGLAPCARHVFRVGAVCGCIGQVLRAGGVVVVVCAVRVDDMGRRLAHRRASHQSVRFISEESSAPTGDMPGVAEPAAPGRRHAPPRAATRHQSLLRCESPCPASAALK